MQKTELNIRRSLSFLAAATAAVAIYRAVARPSENEVLPIWLSLTLVLGGLYFTWRTTQQVRGRRGPTEGLLAFAEGAFYFLLTALLGTGVWKISTMVTSPVFPPEYDAYVWGLSFCAVVLALVSLIETLLAWTRVLKRRERT